MPLHPLDLMVHLLAILIVVTILLTQGGRILLFAVLLVVLIGGPVALIIMYLYLEYGLVGVGLFCFGTPLALLIAAFFFYLSSKLH